LGTGRPLFVTSVPDGPTVLTGGPPSFEGSWVGGGERAKGKPGGQAGARPRLVRPVEIRFGGDLAGFPAGRAPGTGPWGGVGGTGG